MCPLRAAFPDYREGGSRCHAANVSATLPRSTSFVAVTTLGTDSLVCGFVGSLSPLSCWLPEGGDFVSFTDVTPVPRLMSGAWWGLGCLLTK